eukprot:TRINITY_DN2470_c0_g1_i18.p1 TRINITY_DN2470_c0_g1~~TRINITY_DN2470_c0_g1_i18.p1  ORF type:complete len:605 (+),score=184.01 TRINITY_DN2470_c0_g1_i18:77-1891(+)
MCIRDRLKPLWCSKTHKRFRRMDPHQGKQKKKSKGGLGKSLINAKKKERKKNAGHELSEPVEEKKEKLQSVLEMKSMEEFLSLAELSEKTFEAEKTKNVVMINENVIIDPRERERIFLDKFYKDSDGTRAANFSLRIPRKPKWDKKMSKDELKKKENEAFLQWRKAIAEAEEKNEKLSITPFEKNLGIWRQLWQVIERSEVIVQIVDARNPLFYKCNDLDEYASEIDSSKVCVLLINKADFLSPELLQHWKIYFTENNVKHFFFSAKQQQAIINGEKDVTADSLLASREVLLSQLKEFIKSAHKGLARCTVGMVGYPNVGKSSVINVLCGQKKVSVSTQPGRTKHFQTIHIDSEVTLCDCPGLVFPSFTNSKAEMMCSGVISIDHGTDFDTPMILVVQRISRKILEEVYNIKLPEEDVHMSPTMFLTILARERGYVTGSGNPDTKKTAKMVLKDYVNGKLLYCHLRPDYDGSKHGTLMQSGIGVPMVLEATSEGGKKHEKDERKEESEKSAKRPVFINASTKAEEQVDKEFFVQDTPAAEAKLTKQQRRQLKFAARRGEDVSKLSLDEIKRRAEKKPRKQPKMTQSQIKPGYKSGNYKFDLTEQ